MIIYGIGILAFSFLVGQFLGEYLGVWLGVNANVGGVGFAMIILLALKEWFEKKGWLDNAFEQGVTFWGKLYIPVVIAMSASQNVILAISSGFLTILAGILPIVLGFIIFPFLIKKIS